jgi:hypothetical protein
MAQKKDTGTAPPAAAPAQVVAYRPQSNALSGSLDEKLRAIEQIAANLAGLALNGWNNATRCKAACWLADGAGMHPAVFIQNHYVMEIQGKLLVEPKWEFIVGTLQSRVPGFKFEVLEEEDDHAKVRMSDGRNEHTVSYSVEDAKRQGLLGRGGNMWTAGNTREGCLKQAIKRCGRRLSSAALMDLPVGIDGYQVLEAEPERSKPATAAEAIDGALAKAGVKTMPADSPRDVAFEEVGSEPEGLGNDPEPPFGEDLMRELKQLDAAKVRARLVETIRKFYGSLSNQLISEKVAFLYNAMIEERTGSNPNAKFTKTNPIGPVEAAEVIVYVTGKMREKNGAPKPEPEATHEEDEAPPEEEAERTTEKAYDQLMETVFRARRLFPDRQFIQEHPAGSGKFWFTDRTTLREVGEQNSVLVQKGSEVLIPIDRLDAFARVLGATCDEKERAR